MALLHLQLQSSLFTNKPQPYLPTKPKITIIPLYSSSQPSKSTINNTNNDPIDSPPSNPSDKKTTSSTGLGFGSGSTTQLPKQTTTTTGKVKKKGKKERASIIRRTPLEKPAFLDNNKVNEDEVKLQSLNENAFLLTWLGLGGVILIEGIALAASGFLPEEWDKFFVKCVYPSFTPTVFLFVAGTVVYGVYKYLQNESLRNPK